MLTFLLLVVVQIIWEWCEVQVLFKRVAIESQSYSSSKRLKMNIFLHKVQPRDGERFALLQYLSSPPAWGGIFWPKKNTHLTEEIFSFQLRNISTKGVSKCSYSIDAEGLFWIERSSGANRSMQHLVPEGVLQFESQVKILNAFLLW